MANKDIYAKDKNGRMLYTIKSKVRINGVVSSVEKRRLPLTPEEYREAANYIDLPSGVINEDHFTHLNEEDLKYLLDCRIKEVVEDG